MDVICRVCGGKEYTVEAGFYYCNECHTQTQELREEIYDCGERVYLNTNRTKIRQPKSDKTDKDKTWTTWEGYNVILKGLVDELITLGAPSELKFTAFQLWTAYLSAIKVAFFSKSADVLPNLSAAYRLHDAKIIYNFTKVKRNKSRTKSKSNTSIISSVSQSASLYEKRAISRQRTLNKRALVRADYESSKLSENFDTSLSEYSTTSRTASSVSVISKRIKLNPTARKAKLKVLSRRHLNQHCKEDLPCHKFSTSKVSSYYLHSPYHLSISKLYAILYLALLICEADIYIADLIRYIQEGHLSYVNFKHLFPEDMAMDDKFQQLFETQHKFFTNLSLRILVAGIAKIVGVKRIPRPDIESLCQRYVTELQLPDQIMSLVLNLLNISPPKMAYKSTRRCIPNYEGRAMGYIVFSLKMLFGLDDSTEQNVSKLAEQLNKHFSRKLEVDEIFTSVLNSDNVNSLNKFRKFFIWNDWVEYIEFRKLFIAEYHFPTQVKYFPHYDDNTNVFLNFWEKQKSKNDYYEENMRNTKLFTFKKIFENLKSKSNPTDDSPIIEFPPNLTPLASMFEKLNETLNKKVPNLLSQNFKILDIEFLLNPDQFITRYTLNGQVIKKFNKKNPIFPENNFIPNSNKLDNTHVKFVPEKKTRTVSSKNECVKNISKSDTEIKKLIQIEMKRIQSAEIKRDDCITFYAPGTSYWIEPSMLTKEWTTNYFEYVENTFPRSFQWLLKECSQTIEVSSKELYRELTVIEVFLGIHLKNKKGSKKYVNNNQCFSKLLNKCKREW